MQVRAGKYPPLEGTNLA